MAKRRRLTPSDGASAAFLDAPVGKVPDRVLHGGRAAPIAEVAQEAAGAAALSEMEEALKGARRSGRMIVSLPLAQIQTDYLVRDRTAVDAEEMAALKASIAARGQQTPIEVVDLGQGRFGLISGWRRMRALSELHAETGEGRFDSVLVLQRQPRDAAETYLAMVEENEIRVGLSYYERARIVAKAVEQGVYPDQKKALNGLFGSASRAKRSKIKTFIAIVEALDEVLRFPTGLGERAGLTLGRALHDDATLAARLRDKLTEVAPSTAEAELAVLTQAPAKAGERTAQASDHVDLAHGVRLQTHADGRVTLTGLTPDLRGRLVAWLQAQKQ